MNYSKKMLKNYFIVYILTFLFHLKSNAQTPELLTYNSSECNDDIYFSNLNKLQNRILKIVKTDNYYIYKIFVVSNCNSTEQGSIEVKNDTLHLNFKPKTTLINSKKEKNEKNEIVIIEEWHEEIVECDCTHELVYKIKGLGNKKLTIMANGNEIFESKHKYKIQKKAPTFSIVNNDTINMIDIYGLKQGLHIKRLKDGRLHSRINYIDDEKISGLVRTHYNFNGYEKAETYMHNKKYTVRKYFNSGKLIKTCDTKGGFEEGTNCIFNSK